MNTVYLVMPNTKKDCILYGVEYLADSLRRAGYTIKKATEEQAIENYRQFDAPAVYVGSRDGSALIQKAEEEQLLLYHTHAPKGEGFYLHTLPGRFFVVVGGSEVGALYGCVELAKSYGEEQISNDP